LRALQKLCAGDAQLKNFFCTEPSPDGLAEGYPANAVPPAELRENHGYVGFMDEFQKPQTVGGRQFVQDRNLRQINSAVMNIH